MNREAPVSLLDFETGEGMSLVATIRDDGDVMIKVPSEPQRYVCLGRNDAPKIGESQYVAYLLYANREDHKEEYHRRFGYPPTLKSRLEALLSVDQLEPELATDVVNFDGLSAIRITLHPDRPHRVLVVREELVP